MVDHGHQTWLTMLLTLVNHDHRPMVFDGFWIKTLGWKLSERKKSWYKPHQNSAKHQWSLTGVIITWQTRLRISKLSLHYSVHCNNSQALQILSKIILQHLLSVSLNVRWAKISKISPKIDVKNTATFPVVYWTDNLFEVNFEDGCFKWANQMHCFMTCDIMVKGQRSNDNGPMTLPMLISCFEANIEWDWDSLNFLQLQQCFHALHVNNSKKFSSIFVHSLLTWTTI